MKIGIDAHSLEENRTGVGRYLFNLLKYWPKQDVILYFKKKIPDDIPNGKVLNTNSNALFMHYYLPRAAKRDKIDILFCPGYVAPLFYRGKIALVLHDIIYEAQPDLYNWPSIFDRILLKKVSKISAKKAKIIFTCSQFSKKEILKHYKVDPKKVHAIPLAVDIKKEKKDISHIVKGRYIFYIGSIFKRRYIPEIIKAISGHQFLIIGKNCINLDLNQKGIIYKKYVDEKYLSSLYTNADLFIWLSSYEGFGLPPLEAMASNTLVVTTKMGSLPEVVGNAALFVKNPENINEISKTIHKGLTDKKLREKLIKKGLEQAKKFSWQKTAKETLNFILS